jgi:hypothetical protein
MALLLILPAMLLAASSFKIIEIGGESVSLQAIADKVNYTGRDIGNVIRFMQNNKFPVDDNVLKSLAENYRSATGLLVDITAQWVYPLWIHVQNTGVNHYAGTKYCWIERLGQGRWNYSFEDLDAEIGQIVDFDYDEPILLVEKLDGKLRITVVAYNGSYHSDVYYSDNLLWSGVGGIEGAHVGENKEIDENFSRGIRIDVRDPGGIAQYIENIALA